MAVGEDVAVVSAAAAAPTTSNGRSINYWNQINGQTYTNWEQEVVIFEANAHVQTGITGTMYYGPSWQLGITRNLLPSAGFFFSMQAATDMQAPPGGTCFVSSSGRVCSTPVGEEVVGKTIKLFLVKSNRTNGEDLWWSAWALIQTNGRGFYLGQLKAPYQGAISFAYDDSYAVGTSDLSDPNNPMYCVKPPARTTIVWGPPTVSSPVLSARALTHAQSTLSGCYGPSSAAGPFYDGAVVVFGP